MKTTFFASALLVCSAASAQVAPVVLTPEQLRSFDPIGDCEGAAGSVDLRRVMFAENRSIDVETAQGVETVSVEGEDLLIDAPATTSPRALHIFDIDSEVSPQDDDLDLQLQLASLDGRLLLYWRETYRNRIYRQGLFAINGIQVEPLCSGHGGRHTER